MKTIGQILAGIERADAGQPRRRVTILGAGIAGLVSAYELSQRGHKVRIIEGSNRVGGRIHTHKFNENDYHELGAMRIPLTHEFTRHYVTDICGLTLRRFVNHHSRSERHYYIRGIATTHADAFVKLLPQFRISARERQLVDNARILLGLFDPLDRVKNEILLSQPDLNALFALGPMTHRIEELGKFSLGEFLRQNLDTSEAVELLGAITGLEVWWDKAFTMLLRDEIGAHGSDGVLDEIEGGTEELTCAMREKITPHVEIVTGRVVREIHVRPTDVQLVTTDKDGRDAVRSDEDNVICTIPFGVLRRLKLSGLTNGKMRAIRNLTYASSTKVLLHCSERFWEQNGVVGGGSQLDSIARQVYYPSDGSVEEKTANVSKLESALLSAKIERSTIIPKKRSGVLVGSYSWGADARRLGSICRAERGSVVAKCISEIHPEILDPGMLIGSESMFWDENPWAGGAFCFMRPGDFENYYSDTRSREGRLLFAGEHCSLDQGWMQGAIQSSLEATEDLLKIN